MKRGWLGREEDPSDGEARSASASGRFKDDSVQLIRNNLVY